MNPDDTITLVCPNCGKKVEVPRLDQDPPQAIIMVSICDDCDNGGGFNGGEYWDKNGKPVEALTHD